MNIDNIVTASEMLAAQTVISLVEASVARWQRDLDDGLIVSLTDHFYFEHVRASPVSFSAAWRRKWTVYNAKH